MKQKYWYQRGMCKALNYNSLNPVAYKSEDGLIYNKDCMVCNAITQGVCKNSTECSLFKKAPDEMENTWELMDKKLSAT